MARKTAAQRRRSEAARRGAETRRKNRERAAREARKLAKRRSEAARRGWETRRARAAIVEAKRQKERAKEKRKKKRRQERERAKRPPRTKLVRPSGDMTRQRERAKAIARTAVRDLAQALGWKLRSVYSKTWDDTPSRAIANAGIDDQEEREADKVADAISAVKLSGRGSAWEGVWRMHMVERIDAETGEDVGWVTPGVGLDDIKLAGIEAVMGLAETVQQYPPKGPAPRSKPELVGEDEMDLGSFDDDAAQSARVIGADLMVAETKVRAKEARRPTPIEGGKRALESRRRVRRVGSARSRKGRQRRR